MIDVDWSMWTIALERAVAQPVQASHALLHPLLLEITLFP